MRCGAVIVSVSSARLRLDLVKHDGRDYVPIEDVAKFYSFTQADYSNDTVNLEGRDSPHAGRSERAGAYI